MSRASHHRFAGLAVVALAGLALAGCAGSGTAANWTSVPPVSPAAASTAAAAASTPPAATTPPAAQLALAAAHAPVTASLVIVTGEMIGKKDWPAYIPSQLTLPAYSTVVVTITNFDDATPLPKGSERYAQVSGTVDGTMVVTPIDPKDPNGSAGPTQRLTGLDPTQVAHTFTVPALGINVPVAAHARVSFTIRTGAPGTYLFRCFDPCGTGSSGWSGPMSAAAGYMEGTITVA